MPGRVKLLNSVAGGTTGLGYRNGTGQPPYSLYVGGGFTLGGGAAGTQGVNIEVSTDNVVWRRGIGLVGGENYTEATSTIQELNDLPDKTIVSIQQYHPYIRGTTGAGMVGNATLELVYPR